MTDGNNSSFVLGVRVTTGDDDGSIRMDQTHYARQLLQNYGILDARPVNPPLESGAVEALSGAGPSEQED
ncbi:MAG: hypothetical protein BJ554DRAFT_538 [Olpidium bornovanus]|uniref:Reverse transcriptase Ty1/copia-type domain-containing protein n=1 Tax=Olpidium bornovanus TaxID=278681 RepID=A0A8H7ZTW6_9FUNG|nr:MAG: hypothetical protein BJ554DRAFT_538 [Olpidium bornovanus]